MNSFDRLGKKMGELSLHELRQEYIDVGIEIDTIVKIIKSLPENELKEEYRMEEVAMMQYRTNIAVAIADMLTK